MNSSDQIEAERSDWKQLVRMWRHAERQRDELRAASVEALVQAEACWRTHYGDNPEGGPVPSHIVKLRAAIASASVGACEAGHDELLAALHALSIVADQHLQSPTPMTLFALRECQTQARAAIALAEGR